MISLSEINKILTIAQNEIGYLEKKTSNKDYIYSKTANAGYNNYTKYALDMSKIHGGIYANGFPWCDTFVDWCFVQSFGKERAKELLHGWSAYTPTSAGYFKNAQEWSMDPQPGSIIFFRNGSGTICHTGIVTKVTNTHVYTIEGNTSAKAGLVANGGGVAAKKYNKNYTNIAGYGTPKYRMEEDEEEMKPEYNWIDACPEWSKLYVKQAWDLGWIKGDQNQQLHLNDDKIWTLVVMLRAMNIMK